MREHFSGLFEIALVLLGVLSATETQYFIKVWGDAVAIKFSTTPFIAMITVWLIKELYKRKITIEFWLLLSEFCWELWSLTLTFYLLFLWLFEVPTFPQIALIDSIIFGLLMYFIVLVAHYLEYRTLVKYYKSLKWRIARLILSIIGLLVMYSIFLIVS